MTVYFYFDTDGYYLGNGTAQKENSTETEPPFKFGYWQKWNGEKWINKKIADSAKDLEDIAIPDISFEDVTATNHEKQLYALFQRFLDDAHYIEKDKTEKTLTFKAYSDEVLLEKAKAEKLQELSNVADCYAQYKCPIDMYIVSSTGFKVDADVCSQTNMQGLILMLDEGESCQYKDFNNEFQTVTREQLTIMVGEAKKNGLNLYQTKFQLEAQINACTTIEEVEAIEIKFEMLDFSKSE